MVKAHVIRSFGGPDVFESADVPKPQPKAGEVLVRIAAASVNPVDYKIRASGPGISPDLPAVLGCDLAGTVEALDEGVRGFAVGDAVYGRPLFRAFAIAVDWACADPIANRNAAETARVNRSRAPKPI